MPIPGNTWEPTSIKKFRYGVLKVLKYTNFWINL